MTIMHPSLAQFGLTIIQTKAIIESLNCAMHSWTVTDARPGLPRVVRAAINVANSFKISTCSWLLWGLRSRAHLSLPDRFLCVSMPVVATRLSTTLSETHLFDTLSIVDVYDDLSGNWASYMWRGQNTPKRTATQCNTLQQLTAAQCNTLKYPTTNCNTLQHTATHCSILHALRWQNTLTQIS